MCFLVDPEDWPKLRRDFLSHELCQWPRSRPTCAPLFSHCIFPRSLSPSFARDTRFFNPLPLFFPPLCLSLSLFVFFFARVFFKRFSSSVTCNEQLHRRIVHRVKGKWANFFPRLVPLSFSLSFSFETDFFVKFYFKLFSFFFFLMDHGPEFISFSVTKNSFISNFYCFFLFCYIFVKYRAMLHVTLSTMFPDQILFLRVWFIRKWSNNIGKISKIYKSLPIHVHPTLRTNIFRGMEKYFRWAHIHL